MAKKQLKRINGLWLSYLLVALFLSEEALSVDIDDLSEMQAEITYRINNLEKVNHWHSQLILIQNDFYDGPTGLIALSDQWSKRMVAWVSKNDEVLELVRAAEGYLEDLEIRKDLLQRLRDNQEEWFVLKKLAQKIYEQGLKGKQHLEELAELPEDIVADYADATKFLNSKRRELHEAIVSSMAWFHEKNQAHWSAVLSPTLQGIGSVLWQASMRYPNLETHEDYLSQFLDFSKEFSSSEKKMQHLHHQIMADLSAGRIFAARGSFEKLKTLYSNLLDMLQHSGYDHALKEDTVENMKKIYQLTKNLYDIEKKSNPPSWHVFRNLSKNKHLFESNCLKEKNKKLHRCTLINVLKDLDENDLFEMTEEDLEFIEKTIEQLTKKTKDTF